MNRTIQAGALALMLASRSFAQDYKTDDFSKDDDRVALARMIFGEARSCTLEERIAVAYTAVNRANDGVKWNGETVREAILIPKQYSCFNEDDPNRDKLMDPYTFDKKSFDECLEVAEKVLNKEYKDPTQGATSYYNPKGCAEPKWAKKMYKIGKIKTSKGESAHIFFKEKVKEKKVA